MPFQIPRSPYDTLDGLIYFPRMLDKIRLHAAGELAPEYHPLLGLGFDQYCLHFLHVEYSALCARVLAGGMDEELLEWCFQHGRRPSDEEIDIWNQFARKRGWRDASRDRIDFRLKESGLEHRAAEAVTMFDFIEIDEGRTPPDFSNWEPTLTQVPPPSQP